MEKTCSSCGQTKPISEFHKKCNGTDHRCKTCKLAYMKIRADGCRDELKAQARQYYKDNKEDQKRKRAEWREKNRNRKREMDKSYYNRNRQQFLGYMAAYSPEKKSAHKAVQKALRAKALVIPKTCAVCGGTESIEAHHFDYQKPLAVVWLCLMCHRAVHAYEKHQTEAFKGKHEAAHKIFLTAQ